MQAYYSCLRLILLIIIILLFNGNKSEITQLQKLVTSDGLADDRLTRGRSLSMDEYYIIAGSFNSDPNGINSGSVYIFRKDIQHGNWSTNEWKKLIPSS